MKNLVISLLSLGSINAMAQAPALKEKTIPFNDAEIIYHVDNNAMKAGSYYMKDKTSQALLLKGQYTDGQRAGNWYFYGPKSKLEILYNYSQRKLLFLDSAVVSNTTIDIISDNEEVKKNASVPVLLCPQNLYIKTVLKNFDIPIVAENIILLDITADIYDVNNVVYSVSYMKGKDKVTKQLTLDPQSFSIDWIPAMYDKKPVHSKVTVRATLNIDNNGVDRRLRWDN